MFNKKYKQAIKDQDVEIKRLITEVDKLKHFEENNKKLVNINCELVERCNKAEKQAREQTEAGLYFTSAKIQDELLHGKKKKEIDPLVAQQNNFMNQLRIQQSQSMARKYASPFAGLFGVLG